MPRKSVYNLNTVKSPSPYEKGKSDGFYGVKTIKTINPYYGPNTRKAYENGFIVGQRKFEVWLNDIKLNS
jgi:hypothetical protein